MRIRRTLALATVSLVLIAGPALAGTVAVDGQGDPALYVVKVHADWCGACTDLVPVLNEVRTAVADKPVLFVELDVTDAASTAQSRLLAAALGIEEHLKANNRTGLVLLIDPAKKAVVETLTLKSPADEMTGKIKAHIAASGKTCCE
jgi:thiol-disulfide isomerase/thioredoxin